MAEERVTPKRPATTSPSADWRPEAGPLAELLMDPEISEVMVNGPRSVFIEKNGLLEKSEVVFASHDELHKVAVGLARIAGKEVSRKFPYADVRMSDGSRANIVVAPVAVDGPIITIRKAQARMLDLRNLVAGDFFDEKALYFLNVCAANRINMIVSGGTSTGKTTLLNALIGLIPSSERLVTIEDTQELVIRQPNVARLEARGESTYDEGIQTQRLVRNALRMRPDRIIVGETRGGEAWDILQAMNSGHEGSMTAVHANSAMGALNKLEAFILVEEEGISSQLVRQHICDILNVIVQVERDSTGHRHISEIAELTGLHEGQIQLQSIFRRIEGEGLRSTGVRPLFVDRLKSLAIKGFPENFFDPDKVVVLDGFSKK